MKKDRDLKRSLAKAPACSCGVGRPPGFNLSGRFPLWLVTTPGEMAQGEFSCQTQRLVGETSIPTLKSLKIMRSHTLLGDICTKDLCIKILIWSYQESGWGLEDNLDSMLGKSEINPLIDRHYPFLSQEDSAKKT